MAMRVTPDVETVADFGRYYRGSYIPVMQEGKLVPFQVSINDGEYILGQFLTRNADGTIQRRDSAAIRWKDFVKIARFGAPEVGMVDLGPTVVYVYLRPERQWGRGYLPQNLNVVNFNGWDAREKLPARFFEPHSELLMYSLICPEHKKPKEAINQLTEGSRIGCSITNRLGLYIQKNSPSIMVAYRRNTVGYIDGTMQTVRLDPLFAPNAAYIARNLNMEVVA